MEKNLKGKVISGLFWKFGERIVAQGISFVISTILARILMPESYGTVSLVLVFINLANVFITEGMGEALIRKKDADDTDFSTVFYCSIGISLALYMILYFSAQLIANFYENQMLVPILRVLSLQIPLSAVRSIQQAYVSKHLLFKKFFLSTIGGTLLSGVLGVVMALNGAGVWALVAQQLVNSAVNILVLFFTVPWKPRLLFSGKAAQSAFSFGSKLVIASFINQLFYEARSIIIGKAYSVADLAHYQKGDQFPSMVISNINASISSVVFPAMSSVNDDVTRVKLMTRQSMKLTAYVIFPMMVGLALVAKPLICLLLTDKWLPCVPFLQLACLYWIFQPMQTANYQAMKALGKSDVCLKLEVVKKGIGVILILATMNVSVEALAFSNVILAGISMIVNMIPNKKLIDYGIGEQFKDLAPSVILSVVMGFAVWAVGNIDVSNLVMLALQLCAGVAVYVLGSVLFKVDSFYYIWNLLKQMLGRKSNA